MIKTNMTNAAEIDSDFEAKVASAWWNSLTPESKAAWATKAGADGPIAAFGAFTRENNTRFLNMASKGKGRGPASMELAQADAMKILKEAKNQLEETGLEVSLISRCPNGSKWPVLMLEVGACFTDIEKVRNGER